MKKQVLILPLAVAAFLAIALPLSISAHESRIYQIEHDAFQFTVGSLDEPIAVDDKTGVYLKVIRTAIPKGSAMEEDHHDASGAVTGLDKTLKVEISAGDKKKVMDLTPIHGEEGAYRASFIPTVQTTYTYRFFGTIHEASIDVSFPCNPAGHPVSPEDIKPIKLGDEVTQLKKSGAYGCPVAKADLGFPETAMSEFELSQKVVSSVAGVRNVAGSAKNTGMIGIVVGVLGLLAGAGALIKGRKV